MASKRKTKSYFQWPHAGPHAAPRAVAAQTRRSPIRGGGQLLEIWRRKRDSNPRGPSDPNGFQDRRLQPLGHSSNHHLNPLSRFGAAGAHLRSSLTACLRARIGTEARPSDSGSSFALLRRHVTGSPAAAGRMGAGCRDRWSAGRCAAPFRRRQDVRCWDCGRSAGSCCSRSPDGCGDLCGRRCW